MNVPLVTHILNGLIRKNQDPTFLEEQADRITYPVLIKAVKGGGGKGMRIALFGTTSRVIS
jgi:3-methylcrotonyl-CoA carboxylase alpha subunit